MIDVTFDEQDLQRIIDLENRLAGTKANIRRKVLHKTAKAVISNSRAHTLAQADLEGKDYPPHARRRRRKMLVRLARRLKIIQETEEMAVISFPSPVEREIGGKQQYGYKEVVHKSEFIAAQNKQGKKTPLNKDDPATRRQAKALIDAGYKVKPAGKRVWRRPTIKWIVQNLTVGRAGLILRLLRGSKEFWTTVIPPRSFLGATDAERAAMLKTALDTALLELNNAVQRA